MAKVFEAVQKELSKPARKKARMRVHKMTVERGQKGGYVAHHENRSRRDGSPGEPTGPYPIADDAALLAHIKEHLAQGGGAGAGDDEEADDAQPQDGAGGPQIVPPQVA
jgi:hypothetical protein